MTNDEILARQVRICKKFLKEMCHFHPDEEAMLEVCHELIGELAAIALTGNYDLEIVAPPDKVVL